MAEYIYSFDPLALVPEHFGSATRILDSQKSTLHFSEMRASDGVNWYSLTEWKITSCIDDEAGNLDQRYGWRSDGLSVVDSVGHADDVSLSYRNFGRRFTLTPIGITFNYWRELFGNLPSLSVFFTSINPASGSVVLNGSDSRQPTSPFVFDWGDGQTSTGFFPQQHLYAQVKDYIVTVTANYGGGQTDSVQALARMIAPAIEPVALPTGFDIRIATSGPLPTSRLLYTVPSTLAPFATNDFGVIPRVTIEYVLSTLAAVGKDMVNDSMTLLNGLFPQQIWKETTGGFYTIWYADPVSVAAGNMGFAADIPWSSITHEMGHNFTLNFPATYIFGGKIDGNANAIYSETMAQIFQHAAIYEVANNSAAMGLSTDVAFELAQDARKTIAVVRQNYDQYVGSGKPFATWNNPTTTTDETLGTFMTVAYEFLANVEQTGTGYRAPVKRLVRFLQRFNSDWLTRYAPSQNTTQADAFRSTLMVAAVSYGVGRDLRQDFRNLGFPIVDAIFNELNAGITDSAPPAVNDGGVLNNASYIAGPLPVAPGSIAAVFGTNLNDGSIVSSTSFGPDGKVVTTLGGASATINNLPAPMLYSTPGQIGVQIPIELAGQTSATILVTVAGQTSAPRTINLNAFGPGIFTLNQQGTEQAVALHQDNVTPVTAQNPAHPDEIVVFYGTGFGAVTPPLGTGEPSIGNLTAEATTVLIDSIPGDVIFSGAAPGFVGLNQFNVRIPPGTRVSPDIPVVFTIGVKLSNQVTIAVSP